MKITARYLLTKDSFTVQRWLADVWSEDERVSDDFNWLGLAQLSAQKATTTANRAEALAWADIALSAYTYLATQRDLKGKESYDLSSMHLRAAMISRFGAVGNHPILDIKLITKWFCEQTSLQRPELMPLLDKWRTLPIKQIRQLRQIKNRLSVIELLTQNGYLQDDDELREWVMIKKSLP